MTYPVPTFVDALALFIDYLEGEIAEPVVTHVPTPRPAGGFVRLRRTGGTAADRVTDQVQLSVECWEDNEADAMALAQEVRAQLHQLQGQALAGTAIYRVAEGAGPARLPDPVSDQERVTFTLLIGVRGSSRDVSS